MAPPEAIATVSVADRQQRDNVTDLHQKTLTVGKVESGMVVLFTDQMQMMEVPSSVIVAKDGLPLRSGDVISLYCNLNKSLCDDRSKHFDRLQQSIMKVLGKDLDASLFLADNVLRLAHCSHTSITISWPNWSRLWRQETDEEFFDPSSPTLTPTDDDVDDGDSKLSSTLLCKERIDPVQVHAIDAYCNGRRLLGTVIDPSETELKLTGLQPDTKYKLCLRFRTAAGNFKTNELETQTLSLSDLSCLRVAVIAANAESERQVIKALQDLKVQVSDQYERNKTTHVITALEDVAATDELLQLAHDDNVPVISRDWVFACQKSGKMQSVSKFYIHK